MPSDNAPKPYLLCPDRRHSHIQSCRTKPTLPTAMEIEARPTNPPFWQRPESRWDWGMGIAIFAPLRGLHEDIAIPNETNSTESTECKALELDH